MSDQHEILKRLVLFCCILRLSHSCTTDLDCFLNGDCVGGKCNCDPAWQGSDRCDILNILPMNRTGGYHNKSFASWGGNVVLENGKYHLFVAQMVNHCGLAQYGRNSAIVRAESESPGGPFVFKETILLPFAHNPTVRRLPHGGLLLFFTGSGNSSTPASCDPATGKPRHAYQQNGDLVENSIHAMQADTVYGPWSAPAQLSFLNSSRWNLNSATNPSPHIDVDGTITLALQAGLWDEPKALLGVARAKDWRGPYEMITQSPIVPEKFGCTAGMGEDPFLWKTARGWHIIYHGMCPSGVMQAHLE